MSDENKTIGKRFGLAKFNAEEPTSLMIRNDSIVDMREDELTDGDVAFLLRQFRILDFAIPKALAMLKENPNRGEDYDAQLLSSLAGVFPFPENHKDEARKILPILEKYAADGGFELEEYRIEFRQMIQSLKAVLDTPWGSDDKRSLKERFGLKRDERPCQPGTVWLYNEIIERREDELDDSMVLYLLWKKLLPSLSIKKAIVRLSYDPGARSHLSSDSYLAAIAAWDPLPSEYAADIEKLMPSLERHAAEGYFDEHDTRSEYQGWIAALKKHCRQ